MAYPILATQDTWWVPTVSTVSKKSITEIEIMDGYTPDSSVTIVDSWDASDAKDGSITCYIIGTKLNIAGNGSGKIAANTDSFKLFSYFENVVAIDGIENLDTSKVQNMMAMFACCYKLASLNLAVFDTSSATNMRQMFVQCSSLTNLDVSSFDTSNVTNMDRMFGGCQALTSLDLTSFNTSKVTNMSGMFTQCYALTSLDLTNFDTSKVTTMKGMFANCQALTSLNITSFDTSNVTDMLGMFNLCFALTSLDLMNFDTSKVQDMCGMFWSCESLNELDLENFIFSSATNISYMFASCLTLKTLKLGKIDTSNVLDMTSMFSNCNELQGLDVSSWDVSKVKSMAFMFYDCSSLGEIDVSNWNTSNVTSLDHFAAHAGLIRKGMQQWDTRSLVNANAAFHNCAEEELDMSCWDVSKVEHFCQMFENSPNLKRIKGLENWDTSSGLSFDGMFERCYKLEELDLSTFNTTKAKNGVVCSLNESTSGTLQNMFLSCNNLKKVTVGPNFSINGDGTNTAAANMAILPTPSTDYIEGADGMWYTLNGDSYAPNAMKDKTAETYYASYNIVADMDVICKNGNLIDTAKAIREISKDDSKYLPSEFGDAVRSLSVSMEVDEEGNATLINAILTVDENSDGTLGV